MNDGVRWEKRLLARALDVTKTSHALLAAQSLLRGGEYIRVVNYHGTPIADIASFERQMAFLAAHFSPVGAADLARFFTERAWRATRPGIIVSFDDGLRSNAEVAAPVLDRYGLVGWFFVPVGFIDAPVAAQRAFAAAHQIRVDRERPGDRVAMSWDELRTLAARHVVGCHTRTHRRLSREVPPSVLEDEILAARDDLAERLGRAVDAFCWVGGEESSYSAEAARVIRRAGYRFAFMTNNAPLCPGDDPFHIQRTNLEASWSLDVLRFQLSGVMDLVYLPKRRRVDRLTRR
jgi:peptidoglycan/xylan/chitin deacetylase (PgdA/CDA1 family)